MEVETDFESPISQQANSLATTPSFTGNQRKRARAADDTDSPSARGKREKARERQRRKRERDRHLLAGHIPQPSSPPAVPAFDVGISPPDGPQSPANPPPIPQPVPPTQNPAPGPEEAARRERVRAAARERQRKHRAVVKARRMAELGMTLVDPNVENQPLGYRLNEHGQYEPIIDEALLAQIQGADPRFPLVSPHATPGQTFATLILMSTQCNPSLKTHLLRTLHMSNEELVQFEPIIAAAWDHWNHQRAMHYAQAADQQEPTPSSSSHENGVGHSEVNQMSYATESNEFRNRFHRPLTAPSPFQPIPPANPGSKPTNDGSIDPSLATPATRETSAVRAENGQGNEVGSVDRGDQSDGE
ncbi:hypothetical protein SISNIDRAFT_500537 [Sistotremastrum niveocremeum HHB9708]|uniref:Uncharacterized protein n=2 Tax=Sistotremastraceae TaxID=3402574 RepID=A0A165AJ59_9AGAM|nr:hypothetical protein SISNIDRAFT_500537 [Sistotremastrum niveocremeum HHB9708]KZT44024.1 hypothetical protein SISSUDRAFT_1057032 [Sistotremastrum suecicum HHB10207 ss-3]